MAEKLKNAWEINTQVEKEKTQKNNLAYLNKQKDYLNNFIEIKAGPESDIKEKSRRELRKLEIKDFDWRSFKLSSYGHTSKIDLVSGAILISWKYEFPIGYPLSSGLGGYPWDPKDDYIPGTLIIDNYSNKSALETMMGLVNLIHRVMSDYISEKGEILQWLEDIKEPFFLGSATPVEKYWFKIGKRRSGIRVKAPSKEFNDTTLFSDHLLEKYGSGSKKRLMDFLNNHFYDFMKDNKEDYEKKQQLKNLRQETQNIKK
jgi:hypothetical protein